MQSHCRQVTSETLWAHTVQHTPDLKWSQRTDKVGYWHWIIEGFKGTNCRELQTHLMILVTSWLVKKQHIKSSVKYTAAEKMRISLILHSQSLNLNYHWTWKVTALITMKMSTQWLKLKKNKTNKTKQNTQTNRWKKKKTEKTPKPNKYQKSPRYRGKKELLSHLLLRCECKVCFWFPLTWEDRTE